MKEKEWDQKKIAPVQIMMLPAEKEGLKEAAQAEGKTVTDYLLDLHRAHQEEIGEEGEDDDN